MATVSASRRTQARIWSSAHERSWYGKAITSQVAAPTQVASAHMCALTARGPTHPRQMMPRLHGRTTPWQCCCDELGRATEVGFWLRARGSEARGASRQTDCSACEAQEHGEPRRQTTQGQKLKQFAFAVTAISCWVCLQSGKDLLGPQRSSTAARARASRSQTSTLGSCKKVSPLTLSETFKGRPALWKSHWPATTRTLSPSARVLTTTFFTTSTFWPSFCKSCGSDGVLCAIVAFQRFDWPVTKDVFCACPFWVQPLLNDFEIDQDCLHFLLDGIVPHDRCQINDHGTESCFHLLLAQRCHWHLKRFLDQTNKEHHHIIRLPLFPGTPHFNVERITTRSRPQSLARAIKHILAMLGRSMHVEDVVMLNGLHVNTSHLKELRKL